MSKAALNPAVPGWFGKMPSLGDFASRRLPPAFIDGWDGWLQREIARSRAAMGERWLARFLVAPIRRFWIAPGVLGAGGWAGVWMPSVDAVGRHFPFTIAAPCNAGDAWPLARDAADWFNALDATARQVLDPECRIDAFEQSLAALPALALTPATPSTPPGGSRWWCEGVQASAQLAHAPGLPAGAEFDALLQPCP
jgi:type VI secretion system protein ImpM